MTVQLAAPRTSLSFARPARTAKTYSTAQASRTAQPSRAAASSQVSSAAPLRLTRRGRLLLVGAPIMLGGAALLTFVGFFTAPALAAGSAGEQTRTQQISVSTGDSLWGLAAEYAPDRDPREVIADIMELNNLSDAVVPAGAQLYIPVSS
ncbi:LysM peptidoglycan-binding domain-containing protein [Arthrobacter sp. Sa2CUA1]|uniref:LysM peptidoglycan-binding domain-containing protein n=1 Tax=Arthrobacter gallicola TaxID=2762225 RepID=A0ABR8UUI0_9MICC|nr:LysM peptidoglycan-binding domain-containing protein [Arthrobacter gallicola]MBD7995886.1 LysM peptidoglycan-binding domain-containing protein [Arthrobacter gallicola]